MRENIKNEWKEKQKASESRGKYTDEIKDMIRGEKYRRLWLNPSDKHNSLITCDQWPWQMASKAATGLNQLDKRKQAQAMRRHATAKPQS